MALSRTLVSGFVFTLINFQSVLSLKNRFIPLEVAQYKLELGFKPLPILGEVGTIPWCSLSHRGTKT